MVLSKYKSRFRSLVLPYLLWNLLYTLIAIFFSVNPIGIYMNDSWKMIPISIKNVFQGVLYFKYLPVFWFMFYLIIYIILGPVLYLALKNKWGDVLYYCISCTITIRIILHARRAFNICNWRIYSYKP